MHDALGPGRDAFEQEKPAISRDVEAIQPDLGRRNRAVCQAFFEGLPALHQTQGESRDALLLGDAVDPGNVRMIEGREVRLAREASTAVGVARDRVRQDLNAPPDGAWCRGRDRPRPSRPPRAVREPDMGQTRRRGGAASPLDLRETVTPFVRRLGWRLPVSAGFRWTWCRTQWGRDRAAV